MNYLFYSKKTEICERHIQFRLDHHWQSMWYFQSGFRLLLTTDCNIILMTKVKLTVIWNVYLLYNTIYQPTCSPLIHWGCWGGVIGVMRLQLLLPFWSEKCSLSHTLFTFLLWWEILRVTLYNYDRACLIL